MVTIRPEMSFFQHGNGNLEDDVFFVDEYSVGRTDVMNFLRSEHRAFARVYGV